MVRKAVSKKVILDWKGLQEDDGTEIPHSQNKALELLRRSDDFLIRILEDSNDMNLYQDEDGEDEEKQGEETVKNS